MLLKFPKKRYRVADDLESFVHLLCWFAIRFHKHDASPTPGMEHDLHQLVMIYETHGIDQDGYDRGSNLKYQAMCKGFLGFTLDPDLCPTFGKVLDDLMGICKEHYAAILAKKPSFMRNSQVNSTQHHLPSRRVLFEDTEGYIDTDAATEEQQVTSTPEAEPKLKTHKHILSIFKKYLNTRSFVWCDDDKGQDQFPYLPESTTKTSRQPGTHSNAEKRKSRDSSDRNAKRAKATSGTRLESITESL